ncbi:MAG: hypothetical protein J5545_00045, partial [Bacteroidaceae bacterium]|nr:hypothetical protein [Bacteroidaceae bacterium]
NKGSQPSHWLVRNGGEKRVPLGTRQQIPLAYLKARIPLVTTLPANELAGYLYYAPLGLAFPLGLPLSCPYGALNYSVLALLAKLE